MFIICFVIGAVVAVCDSFLRGLPAPPMVRGVVAAIPWVAAVIGIDRLAGGPPFSSRLSTGCISAAWLGLCVVRAAQGMVREPDFFPLVPLLFAVPALVGVWWSLRSRADTRDRGSRTGSRR